MHPVFVFLLVWLAPALVLLPVLLWVIARHKLSVDRSRTRSPSQDREQARMKAASGLEIER